MSIITAAPVAPITVERAVPLTEEEEDEFLARVTEEWNFHLRGSFTNYGLLPEQVRITSFARRERRFLVLSYCCGQHAADSEKRDVNSLLFLLAVHCLEQLPTEVVLAQVKHLFTVLTRVENWSNHGQGHPHARSSCGGNGFH
ncbi:MULTISPECIES: hypothetical protein [unclassified Curtobacterium]|uniref:hypothetical protein n=1 Tax=unclassified Curtobacterium TaxID=257496 RepID=UPI0038070D3F